jgi:hypothetical protein
MIIDNLFPNLTPEQHEAGVALEMSLFWDALYESVPKMREEIVAHIRAGRRVTWLSLEGAISSSGDGLDISRYARRKHFPKNVIVVFGSAGMSAVNAPDDGNLELDKAMAKAVWDDYIAN